jgi:hypothetical protein
MTQWKNGKHMGGIMRSIIRITLMVLVVFAASSAAAQTKSFLYVGGAVAGVFDDSQYGYGSLELRHFFYSWNNLSLGYGAVADIGSSDQYFGGLLTLDFPFSRYVGLSLSTGPGYYTNDTLILGSNFEIRSGLEFYLMQQQGWRISLGIFHYSNAGVSDTNPGSESVRLAIAIPLPF